MPASPSDFFRDGTTADDSSLYPGAGAAGTAGQRLVTGVLLGASFAVTGAAVAAGYLASVARRWAGPAAPDARSRPLVPRPRPRTGPRVGAGPHPGAPVDPAVAHVPAPRAHLRSVR